MPFRSLRELERALLARSSELLQLSDAGALRLTDPPQPELGHTSIACHKAAGQLRRKPDQIASELAAGLAAADFVAHAEAAAGFCNVRFRSGTLAEAVLAEALGQPEDFGRSSEASERWLIEFSGPNTNKPLHIGHLRNTILGSALSRIVAARGHEVLRYNIVNDRGIHICKSMLAYQRWGEGATPESSGQKGDSLVGHFYSLFARRAAEEFEAWAAEHGQAELEALIERERDSLAKAADFKLRKGFLADFVKGGGTLGFKPKKVKPPLYPEKMAAEDGLEDQYQEWRNAHSAQVQQAEQDEAVRRYQAASARRFENEVSELHAAARETLRRWEEGDAEVRALWKTMNSWVLAGLDQSYQRLGVEFDHVDYESEVYLLGKDIVADLVKRGIARSREDGAVVFDMPSPSAKEPPQEKVLLRADGTSVYITQDLGSLLRRVERHAADRMIWVVGSEQELHFQTLFTLVDLITPGLGARCTHLSYGMVELPHGKMKSREGEIIEADGFLNDVRDAAEAQLAERYPELDAAERGDRAEAIALAGAKYNLLRYSKQSPVKFDVDEAIDPQGRSGPYCLYALARTRSILRKLAEVDPTAGQGTLSDAARGDGALYAQREEGLLLLVGKLAEAIEVAVRDLEPYHLADHAYKLAKAFNGYFNEKDQSGGIAFPVVQCAEVELRHARGLLVRGVESALERALSLLGIRTLQSL